MLKNPQDKDPHSNNWYKIEFLIKKEHTQFRLEEGIRILDSKSREELIELQQTLKPHHYFTDKLNIHITNPIQISQSDKKKVHSN